MTEHKCWRFGEWTNVGSPAREFKCCDCHQMWYYVEVASPFLYYLDKEGQLQTGRGVYKMIKVEEYNDRD